MPKPKTQFIDRAEKALKRLVSEANETGEDDLAAILENAYGEVLQRKAAAYMRPADG